jgi:hypothetical protein
MTGRSDAQALDSFARIQLIRPARGPCILADLSRLYNGPRPGWPDRSAWSFGVARDLLEHRLDRGQALRAGRFAPKGLQRLPAHPQRVLVMPPRPVLQGEVPQAAGQVPRPGGSLGGRVEGAADHKRSRTIARPGHRFPRTPREALVVSGPQHARSVILNTEARQIDPGPVRALRGDREKRPWSGHRSAACRPRRSRRC